jgi:septum site-determining protein MinC
MMTLSVLEVNSPDLEEVSAEVSRQIERSPGFFENMPLLLHTRAAEIDLPALVAFLRTRGLVPLGLVAPSPEQEQAAVAAGLGVLKDARNMRPENQPDGDDAGETDTEAAAPAGGAEEAPPPGSGTKLVDKPVRSGQQVYARGGDLIVTAPVSEGAEVIADGHVHIYGALRGRAIAGARGDSKARIFCRKFEADLVAVAGCYKVVDDIDPSVRGKPVRISLDGESLIIDVQE